MKDTALFPSDEEIFKRVCTIFDGLEYALAKHDFHYGIRADVFDDIFDYSRTDNPREEFMDDRMEQERQKLLDKTREFLNIFALYVALDGDYFYPSLRFQRGQKMSETHREKLEGEIETLNTKATELWTAYKDFVRRIRGMWTVKSVYTAGEEDEYVSETAGVIPV